MSAGGENNTTACDGVYGTLDRNDPFHSEGNGTAKFIGTGSGMNKLDFHTIKAANAMNSKRFNRIEMTKNELLHMLCYLEGELQARDVVVAALRSERIKQYIQVLRTFERIGLDDPQAALFRDRAAICGNHVSRQSSASAIQADQEVRAIIEQQLEAMCQVITKQRQTQSRMISVLSESLETNQRMRQELEEEKRKHEHDTAQGDDITYGLEMERTKLKQELETERTTRKKLEKELKKSQELLDFERSRQKQIVLLLLAERKKIIMKYIEERKRSEDLAQILSEEKQRSDSIAEGLEEESKKSLRMEAELEKQTLTMATERKAWKLNLAKDEKRIKEMEAELALVRAENETFRKQMLRMGGASPVTIMATGKVRTDDVSATTVAPSSIMNVAKIVQPTATVSSVPVSGPTTGIARSISPGQCLRQSSGNDLLAGVSAKATPIIDPTTIKPLTQLPSAASGLVPIVVSTTVIQPNTSTILRGGSLGVIAAAAAVAATTSLSSTSPHLNSAGSAIAGATAVAAAARGIPPPIPPNKPIVPPKREPSISRIGSITTNNNNNPTGSIGGATGTTTPTSSSTGQSTILTTTALPSVSSTTSS